VDTEAEQLIRARLAKLRPDDAVLGEEGGGSTTPPAGVRWVVDPIDGTVNFLYGIPAYAVSVAAQVGGRSVAGAVVDVVSGITYSAALGHGATRHGRGGVETPLQASAVESVGFALVATGFGYGAHRRGEQGRIVAAMLPRVRDIRRIGSAALDLCMVAAGLVDAHYEHGLSPWDWAAGSLIATEAGAIVNTPEPTASSADGQVLVACAPGIATEFHAMLDELSVFTALPEP
jgi:myo-inositol-1(or 4)-monophosphatase